MYYENRKAPLQFGDGDFVRPLCAIARFPREEPMPPREWVERGYNVQPDLDADRWPLCSDGRAGAVGTRHSSVLWQLLEVARARFKLIASISAEV